MASVVVWRSSKGDTLRYSSYYGQLWKPWRKTDLRGLRVKFLLTKSTHKYQPLELEIIANSKIRYQTFVLCAIINNTIRWNTGEHDLPLNSQHGRWVVDKGYLPHVAYAITMFNKAWSKLVPSTAVKCSSKSQCLSMLQVAQSPKLSASWMQDPKNKLLLLFWTKTTQKKSTMTYVLWTSERKLKIHLEK